MSDGTNKLISPTVAVVSRAAVKKTDSASANLVFDSELSLANQKWIN